jgi:hypothetical protein
MSTAATIATITATATGLGYLSRIAKALEAIVRVTTDEAAVRERERQERDRMVAGLRRDADELAKRRR